MLRLKDSTGINWYEELLDDPANPGEGLDGVSQVDSSNIVLLGWKIKFPNSQA